MAVGKARRHWIALGILALLTVTLTYPTVVRMTDHVHDPGDPLLNSWIMAWDVHKLTTGELSSLFEANIFYPYRHTLAYSEHLFPQSLVALPVLLVSGNPVLAYNWVLLLSLAATAFAMYLLADYLTGSFVGAVTAGVVFAFSPFMLSHLPHVQIYAAAGFPLTFLFLQRFLDGERFRDLALFTASFVLQILANGYYALFLSLFVALTIVYYLISSGRWRELGLLARLAGAGATAALLAGPFFFQYVRFQRETGFARELTDGANLKSFLAATSTNWLYGRLTARLARPESMLFPGLVALALAVLGIAVTFRFWRLKRAEEAGPPAGDCRGRSVSLAVLWRVGLVLLLLLMARFMLLGPFRGRFTFTVASMDRLFALVVILVLARAIVDRRFARRLFAPFRRREDFTRVYLGIMALSFLFSFGRQGPYTWLHEWVPGFAGMRATQRFHIVTMFGLAVFAAFGVAWLAARLRSRAARAALAVVPALVAVEYLAIPVRSEPVEVGGAVPPVYRWLAGQPSGPLLELPLPAPGGSRWAIECPRVYLSTYHWQPLVNGYSGYFPPLYEELIRRWALSPPASNVADLRRLGVRYLLIHGAEYPAGAAAALEGRLDAMPQLAAVAARFGDDVIYELAPGGASPRPGAGPEDLAPLSRKGWSVSANVYPGGARLAVDGDLATRWTTGPQRPGMSFTVDMAAPRRVAGLTLHLARSAQDYPRGWRIELSPDGSHWTTVTDESLATLPITSFLRPRDFTVTATFAATEARFIRIEDTGRDPIYYWSIYELDVLGPKPPAP